MSGRKANPIKQAEKAEKENEQFNRFLESSRKLNIEEARFLLHENAAKIAELENANKAIREVFPSFTELRAVENAEKTKIRLEAKLANLYAKIASKQKA